MTLKGTSRSYASLSPNASSGSAPIGPRGANLKKDLVIGIVGTAILVVAMVGVFRFEAAQAGSNFTVTFGENETALPPVAERTEAGAATDTDVAIGNANLTKVVFTLQWADDTAAPNGPDSFTLSVTSPGGETKEASGSSGTLEVAFEGLNPPPAEAVLSARDESDASARAAELYTTTGGNGTWVVKVTLTDVGNPGTGALTVPQDTGNEWTLTPTVTTYRATVARA